jgi:hypothetical protein
MTRREDKPIPDAQQEDRAVKKPYEKPLLQIYGDLSEIVKSNTGTNMNDGAGHPNKHFTS